jgi:hypothetical protein
MFDAIPDRYTFEAALRGVAAAMVEDHATTMRPAQPNDDAATPRARRAASRAHLRVVEPA